MSSLKEWWPIKDYLKFRFKGQKEVTFSSCEDIFNSRRGSEVLLPSISTLPGALSNTFFEILIGPTLAVLRICLFMK